jgi:phosphatidylglycerol lysyltransferase
MKNYLRMLAGPLLVLAVVAGAFWLLHDELREYKLQDFLDSLAKIPASALWAAIGLTCLNYVILIGYDLLGVTYLGQTMHWARVAFGSFLGCAVGNNLGNLLGGSTVRYRLYSAWGLTAIDIVRLVLVLSVTFWIGLFAIAGLMFIWRPVNIPGALHLPLSTTQPLGIVLSGLALSYLFLCAASPRGWKFGRWEFSPPPIGLSMLQYVVATMDLMVAASVLYVLLPPSVDVGYWSFLTVYLLGLIATLVTQVPGGIGVLELLIVVLLNPSDHRGVMAALMAFRAIYFLFPLVIGLFMLGLHEVAVHQGRARDAFSDLGRWAPIVAPRLLTLFVFLAGVMLLFAGATPSQPGRWLVLHHLVPVAVVEMSEILGSITGVLLLVLTRGLQRRTEVAYFYSCALLSLGSVLLILQGAHYATAVALAVVLVVFIPARPYFFRRGVRLSERVSVSWLVAVIGAVGCTVWLFVFEFRHVQYRHDLWWQFELDGTAARSLRATFAAVVVSLTLLAFRVLRIDEPVPGLPTHDDLLDANRIASESKRAISHLVAVGDKRLMFNRQRDGFVMFGLKGNSSIAMGDPVGPDPSIRELAWEFWELCDVSGRRTVFYQVGEETLPLYVELGLAIIQIGEEARVFLPEFNLAAPDQMELSTSCRRLKDAGCSFEIVDALSVARILPELRHISDAWLTDKGAVEKRFSVGYFQDDYLQQNPVAVARQGKRIVAFANVWQSAHHEELSIDLLRYPPDAPDGIMEFLVAELMYWGRNNGFCWFNLGLAPPSDVETHPHAPLWNELADVVFRHTEHFFTFEGLREYKQKFRPQWSARYLACPGDLTLPVVLADVASLIAGGTRREVTAARHGLRRMSREA